MDSSEDVAQTGLCLGLEKALTKSRTLMVELDVRNLSFLTKFRLNIPSFSIFRILLGSSMTKFHVVFLCICLVS